MGLFDALGLLLALYTARCVYRGEVYGRSGLWGRSWYRDDEPAHYWSVVVIYAVLSLLLVFWF